MQNNSCKKGFTLIELLVVVLIIGILAAIALPQYQKAVWKSRSAELISMVKATDTAYKAYVLTNSNRLSSFDELDISFDSLTRATALAQSFGMLDGYVKGNNEVYIGVNDIGLTIAAFATGPYAMSGFAKWANPEAYYTTNDTTGLDSDTLYCYEYGETSTGFCEKLQHGTLVRTRYGNEHYYRMK